MYILTTSDGAGLPAAAVVEDFPILVRLHRDSFDFGAAAAGGADIRFATDQGEALSYQIDEWDAAAGAASVWVRVPRIQGDTLQAIRMFWGRAGAIGESNGDNVFTRRAGFAHEAIGNQPAALHHIDLAAKIPTVLHYVGEIARMHAKLLRSATGSTR